MANLIPNRFSNWELSDEEAIQGAILTITQKQVIQNDIADYAQNKNNLEYDATNPTMFIQQEAKLAGQIEALEYRITCSEAAEEELVFKTNNPETPQI